MQRVGSLGKRALSTTATLNIPFLNPAPQINITSTKAFIDGEWVSSGKTFHTINPATEEPLAEVTLCGPNEVEQAVAAARKAFYGGEWPKTSGYQRGILINKLADLIEQNADEIAMLECLDNGKPFLEAKHFDVAQMVRMFRYCAGMADKILGIVSENAATPYGSNFSYIAKEPVGVAGQIIPWNFPGLMQAWKLAPALATGCTVVMKPAPQTPLVALKVAELARQAGFPRGVINIVPGDDETGKLVARHPKLDKLAFTGSTAVGKKIMEVASHDLKRVTLELGGKSPMIILNDADIEKILPYVRMGTFFNTGQVCCATSRVFVNKKKKDQFVEKIAAEVNSIHVGPGWEPKTQQGPQISKEQFDTVHSYIASGISQGATVIAGGPQKADKGFFIRPTVFDNTHDDMKIVKEEIFGPVMTILPYEDDEEVIARANSTHYGLAASVFTSDITRAHKFAKGLRAGTVWVNGYGLLDPGVPFGGFKQSGIGRELGPECLDPYLERKAVVFNLI